MTSSGTFGIFSDVFDQERERLRAFSNDGKHNRLRAPSRQYRPTCHGRQSDNGGQRFWPPGPKLSEENGGPDRDGRGKPRPESRPDSTSGSLSGSRNKAVALALLLRFDDHLDVGRYVAMQAQGYRVLAERANRLIELNLSAVDVVPLRSSASAISFAVTKPKAGCSRRPLAEGESDVRHQLRESFGFVLTLASRRRWLRAPARRSCDLSRWRERPGDSVAENCARSHRLPSRPRRERRPFRHLL